MSDLGGIVSALKVITMHSLPGDSGPAPDNGPIGWAVDIAPNCLPVPVTDHKMMWMVRAIISLDSTGISDDEAVSSHRIPHNTLRSLK
jgi:hypothetical protein